MQARMKPLPVIACCAPLATELTERRPDELESLFGALADKNRVKIVSMLLRRAATPAASATSSPSSASASPR